MKAITKIQKKLKIINVITPVLKCKEQFKKMWFRDSKKNLYQ